MLPIIVSFRLNVSLFRVFITSHLPRPVENKRYEEGVNSFHRRHKIINVKELGTLQTLALYGYYWH